MFSLRHFSLAALTAIGLTAQAQADEAVLRKALSERLPSLKIDEVSKTPIPGLYELRIGTDIMYSDETGSYLIDGSIFEVKSKTDLTKARIDKLTAIDFNQLQTKDALVIKQGTGARKVAVFADPNCGYCKRLEKDMLSVKDVTIYVYLLPILGPDSNAKAKDIWCAKDGGKVWRSWMIDGNVPAKNMEKCDTAALDRNLELARKHKINGTPALVYEDGTRTPGAVPAAQIEKQLAVGKKG